mgnify:CR=1 FL=1
MVGLQQLSTNNSIRLKSDSIEEPSSWRGLLGSFYLYDNKFSIAYIHIPRLSGQATGRNLDFLAYTWLTC